ncbi:MAG: protein kinase [Planctomycetes bacterium]|nr:protein kinase [Planctomycetota bacterium]
MTDPIDAVAVSNLAVRMGLITPDQIQMVWNELGKKGGEALPFLRAMERRGWLTPWQTHKLEKMDRDGYFLGGYRILYRIKAGTFGRVYRAENPSSGEVVAIKVLRRKWSDNPHNIELFEREGRLGMTLHHSNIVEILAVSHDMASKQFYIVMEFVEGGDLRDLLAIRNPKKLEPDEALKILEDVTAGLQFALSKGITHRDMKLTNVLLSAQRTAKLVDFGLAGAWGKAHENEESNVDRTVDYAGLERATNVPPGDTRSDIYFLGCVAYEILTGRAPLKATRNPRSRMQKERFTNIAPILPIEVPRRLEVIRLVETMMSLNPHERFQTPSQLMEAIRDVRKRVDPDDKKRKELSQKTVFVIERDDTLMNVLREKLREKGLRVLISVDPIRALERFRQKPFEILIIDASTTGEEGLLFFDRIMNEGFKHSVSVHGILMLGEDQTAWKSRVTDRPNQTILVQPVKLRQLLHKISDIAGPQNA